MKESIITCTFPKGCLGGLSTGQGSISSSFMRQSDMHNSVDLVFLETVHVYHLVNLPCSPQIHYVVQRNLNKKTIFSRVAEK